MALGAAPLPEPTALVTRHHVTASLLDWVHQFLCVVHQLKPFDEAAFKVFALSYCRSLAPATLDQYVWLLHGLEGIMGAPFA